MSCKWEEVLVRVGSSVEKRAEGEISFLKVLQCFMDVVMGDRKEAHSVSMDLPFEDGDEFTIVFPIPGNSKIEVLGSYLGLLWRVMVLRFQHLRPFRTGFRVAQKNE